MDSTFYTNKEILHMSDLSEELSKRLLEKQKETLKDVEARMTEKYNKLIKEKNLVYISDFSEELSMIGIDLDPTYAERRIYG